MTKPEIDEFVRRAEEVYARHLKGVLEPEHVDEFVAIEPESGDYFLGKTLSEAIGSAQSYPDRLAHAMRSRPQSCTSFWSAEFWSADSMKGHVDGIGRALVVVSIRPTRATVHQEVEAWIDTGFNGDSSGASS